jgi:hypothetical protein
MTTTLLWIMETFMDTRNGTILLALGLLASSEALANGSSDKILEQYCVLNQAYGSDNMAISKLQQDIVVAPDGSGRARDDAQFIELN